MDMDKKEETLEEMSLDNKIEPDKMIEDVLNEASLSSPATSSNEKTIQPNKIDNNLNSTVVSNNSVNTNSSEDSSTLDETDSSNENEDEEDNYSSMSSGKKKLIITILSILLVLDIAALIIYFIGIDKVLGFIK